MKNPLKIVILPALALCAAVSARAEFTRHTWIGGSSGDYSEPSNWDPAMSSSGSSTELYFTGAATVNLPGGITFGRVTVADGAGTVNLATSASSARLSLVSEDNIARVHVGTNSKLLVSGGWTVFKSNPSTDVIKTGAGTFEVWISYGESLSNGSLKTLDVQEGTFSERARYSSKIYITDTLTIRNGATFTAIPNSSGGSPQYFVPETKIVIEEGGTLDYTSALMYGGTIGCLTGAGTLKSGTSSDKALTIRSTGDGSFSGKITGYVKFQPGAEGETVTISGAETLADATQITIVEPTEWQGTALAFAPGTAYSVSDPHVFAAYTQDAAGNPLYFMKDVKSGTTYNHTGTDDVWPENWILAGSGTVVEKGAGFWRIGNFAMTNGTLKIDSTATSTNLILAGGCSTNVDYSAISAAGFKTTFLGGDRHFRGWCNAYNHIVYEQYGGTVIMDTFCTLPVGSDYDYTEKSPYRLYGGEFYCSNKGRSFYGFGLEVGGNGVAKVTSNDGGSCLIAYRDGHTVRVKDNGTLDIDNLVFANYGGCGSRTGAVEVVGGRINLQGAFGYANMVGSAYSADFNGWIVFDNGGVFNPVLASTLNPFDAYASDANLMTYVREGGGTILVSRSRVDDVNSHSFTWCSPVVPDVAEGHGDGGLTLIGNTVLKFTKRCELTGPMTVRHGIMSSTFNGATPFGTGDIVIDTGMFWNRSAAASITVAAADGKAIRFMNGSTFRTSNTVMAGGLERVGHGVLFLSNYADGKLKLVRDVAVDDYAPITRMPIFTYNYRSYGNNYGSDRGLLPGFATYDGEIGFKAVAANRLGGGSLNSSGLYEVFCEHCDLTENAHIGGLLVSGPASKSGESGLTLADGVTLSIGNGSGCHAPLLLASTVVVSDRSEHPTGGGCVVTGGTIDFGAAEGVVAVGGAYRNFTHYDISYLNSKLTGTGGITYASPYTTQLAWLPRYVSVGGDNDYTGGTWIENCTVSVRRPTGFGGGTVTVDGNAWSGGRAEFAADFTGDSFDNALVLSGVGPQLSVNDNELGLGHTELPGDGALAVLRPVSFGGGVTLAGDTRVYVGGRAVATFAGTVSGDGALEICGEGTVRLETAGAYRGATVVRAGATLELGENGAIGQGPLTLEKGACLRVPDASKIPAGLEAGEGRVEIVAPVTDGGDLVKTGDDVLELVAAQDYPGSTQVQGGTLRLGAFTPDELPLAESISFRVDASDSGTITADGETGRVSAWADADGRTGVFQQDATGVKAPVYDAEAFGGLGGVVYDGSKWMALTNTASKSFMTVFAVTEVAGDAETRETGAWNNTSLLIWDASNGAYVGETIDQSIKMANSAVGGNWGQDAWATDGKVRVDGADRSEFPFGRPHLLSVVMGAKAVSLRPAIGNVSGQGNGFYGAVGEIIAYNRFLNDAEVAQVENYLMRKWGIVPVKRANVLPAGTDVTVAEGAVIDLAGADQDLSTLDLSGEIINTSPRLAVVKLLDGTSYVRGGTFGENVELHIGRDAVLDLGGETVYVDYIRTYAGAVNVVNGTLVARKGVRRPISGMMMFIR